MRLSDEFVNKLRAQLADTMSAELGDMTKLRCSLGNRLTELGKYEDGFLDLLDDPEWPQAKIKKKLAEVKRERMEIATQLEDSARKLDSGSRSFEAAISLLADPQAIYRRGSDAVKDVMAEVIFGKLNVDAVEGSGAEVVDHELNEGVVEPRP
ncbi:MAG TPA: hypothetical protein VGL46_14250 [Pseudonocardiaceae bacterium]